jgi:predicted GNAT family acetyltransferase
MKDAKGHGSNTRGTHSAGIEAALKPVKITSTGDSTINAFIGNKLVGRLILTTEGDDKHNSVFKVAVEPEYRGRGVATQMYQHAEKELGSPLRPSTALTDDGYAFWNHYRPEAVADDLRGIRGKLMGHDVTSSYGAGRVTSVGRNAAIATDVISNYSTWPVPKSEIERLRNAK